MSQLAVTQEIPVVSNPQFDPDLRGLRFAFIQSGWHPEIVDQGRAAFVQGITAAAIGALSGAVVVIAGRSIRDIPTVIIALVTLAILWKTKKVPEPVLILAAAVIGLVIYPLLGR